MHQHPRPSPRSRDRPPQRTRSSVDLASYTERGVAETTAESSSEAPPNSQDRDTTKLNQIIQVGTTLHDYKTELTGFGSTFIQKQR